MNVVRRTAAAVAAALVAALIFPLTAQAAGYQFWGYYHLVDDEWVFATEGLATTVPEEGSVHGLRFAVSSGEDVRTPRAVRTFDEVCADVEPEDASKRVALVIDTGRDVDAPDGETPPSPGAQCIVADEDATTLEIIGLAVEDVRTDDNAMLCGLAGFPTAGCSEEVAEPTPEQLAEDEPIEIPVVPVGDPILAAPAPAPTSEPTGEPTEDATQEPTEEPTEETTTDAAETSEDATDESTEPAEETTEQATDGEESQEETQAPPSETPEEAEDQTDSADGIPPWAWAVGILVLLGILAFVATSARNRRLEALRREEYPEGDDDYPPPPGAGSPDGPVGPQDR